jgi:GTPase SAR1 family protein
VPILKAVILGDSEVGKTSFSKRWTQGTFPNPELLRTTVGASFDTLRTTLPNGEEATLSVWDFGGQKRFIETLKTMIMGAKLGLFFFDASHLQSLDNLYNYWIPLAQQHGNFDFSKGDGDKFLTVANKIDLLGGDFSKLEEEMERISDRFGMRCVMLSAKTGVGMEHLDYEFRQLCQKALGPK